MPEFRAHGPHRPHVGKHTEKGHDLTVAGGLSALSVDALSSVAYADAIRRAWTDWDCGITSEVLVDPHRSLIRTVLKYVKSVENEDALITVLIPQIIPTKRRHEILHNQRGRLLESVLKARIGVVIATLPFHIHD
jgi:hypothetical protein